MIVQKVRKVWLGLGFVALFSAVWCMTAVDAVAQTSGYGGNPNLAQGVVGNSHSHAGLYLGIGGGVVVVGGAALYGFIYRGFRFPWFGRG